MQAQAFYDDLNAVVKQLSKMVTYLATTKQVGLLPETLRSQQRQFMVSRHMFMFTLSVSSAVISDQRHICCICRDTNNLCYICTRGSVVKLMGSHSSAQVWFLCRAV